MIYVPGSKSSHHGTISPNNGRFSPCGPRVPEYFSEAPPFLYILLLFRLLEKCKKEKKKKTQFTIPRLCMRVYVNRVTYTYVYIR